MLRPVTFSEALEVVGVGERVNVQVKIDEDVWDSFKSFVIEAHGQKYGNLGREVENALNEYTDNDRYARIEANTEELLTLVRKLDGSHTHKQSETVEKTERIAKRIGESDRTVIPEDTVHRAIETVAGADDRTVSKYERQLKRRGLAYEHPSDSLVWTMNRERWIEWTIDYVNNNPTVNRVDVIEDYPIDYDELDRLATEVVTA